MRQEIRVGKKATNNNRQKAADFKKRHKASKNDDSRIPQTQMSPMLDNDDHQNNPGWKTCKGVQETDRTQGDCARRNQTSGNHQNADE